MSTRVSLVAYGPISDTSLDWFFSLDYPYFHV
jgi:hypothetical protein